MMMILANAGRHQKFIASAVVNSNDARVNTRVNTRVPEYQYQSEYHQGTLCKKVTIHQVTTILAICKNVLFPGHNHLLTTGTDDASLVGAWAIIKVSGHQYLWLAAGYDLEIVHFQKWLAWWLPGG